MRTSCFFEEFANPPQLQSYKINKDHIAAGFTIIHYKEYANLKLVSDLHPDSKYY